MDKDLEDTQSHARRRCSFRRRGWKGVVQARRQCRRDGNGLAFSKDYVAPHLASGALLRFSSIGAHGSPDSFSTTRVVGSSRQRSRLLTQFVSSRSLP